MLRLLRSGTRLRDGLTPREWLRLGGIGSLGPSLPQRLTSRASGASPSDGSASEPPSGHAPRAKACIQLYLSCGPGAQETCDPKPHAPDGTRGDFKPIATSLPGFHICEH